MRKSNYDKFPAIELKDAACWAGWEKICTRLRQSIGQKKCILAIETYPGVLDEELLAELTRRLTPSLLIDTRQALLPPDKIDSLVAPDLGGNDPVFGRMTSLSLDRFFQPARIETLKRQIETATGLVLVYGTGATLLATRPDILVYADLARWEIQMRQRRNEITNLGVDNRTLKPSLKYKRAFFIDWRVADTHKYQLLNRFDFLLDTNLPNHPKLIEGETLRRGLRHAATRPFRVVPFFDPGPWGGQWMKEVCDLDRAAPNFAWCFDCVPEENSLLLNCGHDKIEIPALDLVLFQPRELLGEKVFNKFGAEFPIRFDFLDTIGGGNLSLQVHPIPSYIKEHFGMMYTQDESYYMLDAGEGATVYLGFREGIDKHKFTAMLKEAQSGRPLAEADVENFVNRFPAKKHDHFLIPAGTIHCSGKNAMVLEISATPYIFTFKLWDWARLGLDGRPRPIHLQHGEKNLQWNYTTPWVRQNLINRIEPLADGENWREERTGLHELEFIETRRHWFTAKVPHHTNGSVNVLNLVEGEEAIIESPTAAFEPFIIHYAETFIVPAAAGPYTIRPHGPSTGKLCATLKAFVRV